MPSKLITLLARKKIAILGYGLEGKSTHRRLREWIPGGSLAICDQNPGILPEEDIRLNEPNTVWYAGQDYLQGLSGAEIIIKAPGIPYKMIQDIIGQSMITSQTDLFVRLFRDQTNGITGTKGKSTTSCLLHHIFTQAGVPTVLLGNIGTPPFDLIDQIDPSAQIVAEMSSHQLEQIQVSPHKAALLNIYQEHLDHYTDYNHYQQAKLNIARWQSSKDFFLYNSKSEIIRALTNKVVLQGRQVLLDDATASGNHACFQGNDLVMVLDGTKRVIKSLGLNHHLPGEHNRINIEAAAVLATMAGVAEREISKAVSTFKGLPHRLERLGRHRGVDFVNDSISTIPESAQAAIHTFPETTTLILGGYDRGVDYLPLMQFLGGSAIKNIIFTGMAGKRMFDLTQGNAAYKGKYCYLSEGFDEAVREAVRRSKPGELCLLSPAAASYDAFNSFAERGERFRKLVSAKSKIKH